jgi:hypothetical protein
MSSSISTDNLSKLAAARSLNKGDGAADQLAGLDYFFVQL